MAPGSDQDSAAPQAAYAPCLDFHICSCRQGHLPPRAAAGPRLGTAGPGHCRGNTGTLALLTSCWGAGWEDKAGIPEHHDQPQSPGGPSHLFYRF